MGFKRSDCTFIVPASKLEELKELIRSSSGSFILKDYADIETTSVFRKAVEVRLHLAYMGGYDFGLFCLVKARIPFFLRYDGCDGEYEAGWACWAPHMDAVVHLDGCLQPHVKQMPDCTFKITYQTLVKAVLHNSELIIDTDPGDRSGTLLRRLNSLNSVLNTIEETK